MTKKIYQAPTLHVVEVCSEGMIATSDRIPVNPTPSAPATQEKEYEWDGDFWGKDE